MADTLARILEDKRRHLARAMAERPLAAVEAAARAAAPVRGFAEALARRAAEGRPALIAEIKKASPSRGLIRADFDPPALARAFESGGASCLSVLTDTPWFQGRDEHLVAARAATPLPVLRKDFTIDPWQVVEARALGADCVLLIMAALDDGRAAELMDCAHGLGLDVLVEVHDAAELERALRLEPKLLGINNRNLKTLTVDLAVAETLAPRAVATGRIVVAESGIHTPADIDRLQAAGASAFLVGESLMKQEDVTVATLALLSRPA